MSFTGISPSSYALGYSSGNSNPPHTSFGGMRAKYCNSVEFVSHNCWFPRSGATNHASNDNENLSISSEYEGSGKIHIENGTGFPISHIGYNSYKANSRVPSKRSSSSPFH